MQEHHQLLQTIYEIVKNDPQPEHYGCRPREIILRRLQEWPVIHQQLLMLCEEGFVSLQQQDTLIIRITPEGIEKVKQMNKKVRSI